MVGVQPGQSGSPSEGSREVELQLVCKWCQCQHGCCSVDSVSVDVAMLKVFAWMLLYKQCYHGVGNAHSVSVDVAVKTWLAWILQCKRRQRG